jgi:signal transduction histidine kinase
MRLIYSYLKTYWKTAAAFVLFAAVFTVVFALYELPVQAVGYAALICAMIGAVLLSVDFVSFCRRHKRLVQMEQEIAVAVDGLPSPAGTLEEDYQRLLDAVHADKLAMSDEMGRRYAELVDYYTVWAHQIKTPIAAMRLLLQQNADTPGNRELSDELQRIEQYVEMVLGYLRLNSDTTDYVIREYDLDDIVRQAVRAYASQFIRRKIRLEYEPLSCRVLTDEKWLLFAVEQVLSNALKYTKAGSVSITLEAKKTLCIRDTGIGIAPEDLPRVFEKGYTGYNGRADKKATGIGLYLCRRILGKLGHTISIESKPGGGTAVRLGLESAKLTVE